MLKLLHSIKIELGNVQKPIKNFADGYKTSPNNWYDDEVWEYYSGPHRDYKNINPNMTVAAIASIVLAAIIPYAGAAILFGLAGMYFERKSECAYVEYTTYKAANRPKLKPAFKAVSYLYFDPEYSIKLRHEDNPVITYVKR